MNHPPAVGERHRVRDPDERLNERQQAGSACCPLGASAMIVGDRFGKCPATNETHGVIRTAPAETLFATSQLVNRYDARVVEPARDPSLLEEPLKDRRIVGRFRTQLLEGDLAIHLIVAGKPDLADPSFGMQAGQRIAVSALGTLADSREIFDAASVFLVTWNVGDASSDVFVFHPVKGGHRRRISRRDGNQALTDVSRMLFELVIEQLLDQRSILGRDPAAIARELSDRAIAPSRP